MNTHLTDEDLILHFYGDRPARESEVDGHLQRCAECRQTWQELQDTLQLVDRSRVPEPDAGFERVMWARVQQRLDAASEPRGSLVSRFWKGGPRGLAAVGAAAAVVIAVVAGGYTWRHRPDGTAPGPDAVAAGQPAAVSPHSRERVLLAALDDHFQQSEMLLVEVLNAPAHGTVELGFERETADELLGSSRLYRLTAQQNGDVRLAQMLEDLESALVEIARSPEHVTRRDFDSLRARIDDDNLLFKVRAVSQQIHDRQRSLSTE